MKRHFCIFAEAGIWLSAASIVLSGCGPGKESKTALVSETSLFSWEEEYILPEMEEEVEKGDGTAWLQCGIPADPVGCAGGGGT